MVAMDSVSSALAVDTFYHGPATEPLRLEFRPILPHCALLHRLSYLLAGHSPKPEIVCRPWNRLMNGRKYIPVTL